MSLNIPRPRSSSPAMRAILSCAMAMLFFVAMIGGCSAPESGNESDRPAPGPDSSPGGGSGGAGGADAGADGVQDSGSTEAVCEDGTAGCACYGNATCNAGLACTSGRCISDDCQDGVLGCLCDSSGTCNGRLRCEEGFCTEPHDAGGGGAVCEDGTAGCACYGNATCNVGLVCVDGLCTSDACEDGSTSCACEREGGCDAQRPQRLWHEAPCDPGQNRCTVPMAFATQQDLTVRLVDADGVAIPNRGIAFAMVQPVEAAGTALRARSAFTNQRGVATVSVNAGSTPGLARILASVSDAPEVPTLEFQVLVQPRDSAHYAVGFGRTGNAPASHVDVYLYPPEVTCEALARDLALERDNNPATFPQITAEFTRRGLVHADGTFPDVIFPNVRNGESYTVASKVYSAANDELEVAYGCKASNPPVVNGQPVAVQVELKDHLPLLTGTYNVVHTFEMQQDLPPSVREVVDMIGRIVTDPGSFLVGCPSNPPDPSICPPASDGIVQIFVDFLPDGDLKDSILSFLNSNIANAVIRDLVNEMFFNYVNTNAPEWLRNTRTITQDIYTTLKQFRVEAKMFFNQAPVARADQNGNLIYLLPDNSGRQLWNTLIFRWSRGCEGQPQSCSVYRIASTQLGTNAAPIEGLFSGALLAHDKLEIFPHTLSFNYGTIILAVIERIALPEIFGPQVNSIDTLLTRFINCQSLAEQASSSANVQTIVRNLCTNLLSQGAGSLRDYVTQNLVVQGNDHFRISTPDGQACTIHQPASYVGNWPNKPLPYIEGLGKSEPAEMQCKWDVRLRFNQETETTLMPGTFFGVRQGL